MSILKWIEHWYQSQYNGDWEHGYGVRIETTDNPGWVVEINLLDTELDHLELEYSLIEVSEEDWYGVSIKDSVFKGVGDTTKLEFLLNKFKEIIEKR